VNQNHTQSHASRRARVLVALKESDYARAMLEHAKSLAAEGAKLWVVHVLIRKQTDTDATLLEQLESAEAWLRKALTEAGLGAGALPMVVVGEPAEEILSATHALDAEVVLLGAGRPEGAATPPPGPCVGKAVQEKATSAVVFFDLRTSSPLKAP